MLYVYDCSNWWSHIDAYTIYTYKQNFNNIIL